MTGYLPTLDGWRAIAIWLVLLNHDWAHRFGPFTTQHIRDYGRRGVDIFFALSGILICTRLLQEEETDGRISLKSFYLRRLFRIQPAALAYLAVITFLMTAGVLGHAFHPVLYAAISLRNWLPLTSGPHDWYTMHFWSLSLEEQFYLLLPAFLLFVHKWRIRILASAVCLMEIWKYLVLPHLHRAAEFGWAPVNRTDYAADGILLGTIAALLLRHATVASWCREWLKPWIVLPVTALVWRISFTRPWPIVAIMVLGLYPLLITSTMLHPQSWSSRLLETRPMRFVGRLSYSLYLWQMLFYTSRLPVPNPHSELLLHLQTTWLRYPATLLLAFASHVLLEKPFIRLGHRLANAPFPAIGRRRKPTRGTLVGAFGLVKPKEA